MVDPEIHKTNTFCPEHKKTMNKNLMRYKRTFPSYRAIEKAYQQQRVTCECGKELNRLSLWGHMKSKKHHEIMDQMKNGRRQEIPEEIQEEFRYLDIFTLP